MNTTRKPAPILLATALLILNLAAPAPAEEISLSMRGPVRAKMLHRCKPGPWGDLEYYATFLEAPERFHSLWPKPPSETVWHIGARTESEVESFFRRLPIEAGLLAMLLDKARWSTKGGVVTVRPKDEVIRDLPRGAREVIYGDLRRWKENMFHCDPVFIEGGDVAAWFASSGLPAGMVAEIGALSYSVGGSLAFSDLPFVLRDVSDAARRQSLAAKIRSRTRSLVLRLRVSESSDLRRLEEYWTAGRRYKDALPLLRSVAATEGVERIDVVHLLPPLPRRLLYTYSTGEQGLAENEPNCHWTCANFFDYHPNNRFLDAGSLTGYLNERTGIVKPPYRFGDILVFFGKGGDENKLVPLHSCVQIADDIVYTKNGDHMIQPWVLMKLGDVLSRYPTTMNIQAHRLRGRTRAGN